MTVPKAQHESGVGSEHRGRSLAVIGGGLAGISAAESAAMAGWNVELFEWRRVLGGRAASQFEPISGRWIDNGQHVVLGCCTELLNLHKRLGIVDLFDRNDNVPFAASDDRRWNLTPSPYLPPRWQLLPAFLKNPFLTFKDRLATGLLLRKLVKPDSKLASSNGAMNSKTGTFGDWLRNEGVSDESMERFWSPLVFSSLSEAVDYVSLDAAKKVVKDGFMSGRDAMSVYVPKYPLRDIYHVETLRKLELLGVQVNLLSRVQKFDARAYGDGVKIHSLVLANGIERQYDAFVLAIPAYRASKLLEESNLDECVKSFQLERFELGAITAVHLWFDRPVLPKHQRQTAILDGPGQWLFSGSHPIIPCCEAITESVQGYYHQVVISASHRLLSDIELTSNGCDVLVERIMVQLRNVFPESMIGNNAARLIHSKTSTVFDAVFSPTPDIYKFRPPQKTVLSNLAIAGDWTQTDWPATMEGAVRSGLAAVDSLSVE